MDKWLSFVLFVMLVCNLTAFADVKAPIVNWDFGEGRGTILHDTSGNEFHGDIHGAKWVKSDGGYALEFNGLGDYVGCGNGQRLGLKNEITFSAWINPKADPTKEAVIIGEVPFRWTATLFKGRVWFYINSGKNICAKTVPFEQWTHIAGSYDGRVMKFYVNGNLAGTRELSASQSINTGGPLYIGGKWDNRFYKGLIKDVKIFGQALSDQEIKNLAKQETSTANEKIMPIQPEEQKSATQFFQNHKNAVEFQRQGRQVLLANSKVGIGFLQEKERLCLTRFYGIETGEDFLSSAHEKAEAYLWQLVLRRDKGLNKAAITIDSNADAKVSSQVDEGASGKTLKLKWAGVDIPNEPGAIDVEVTVSLKEGDPLSRWRVSVTNRSKIYGLWYVKCPNFSLKPIGGEAEKNFLTVPWARGMLVQDPFENLQKSDKLAGGLNGNWGEYPAYPRVMQFQSLYHESGNGLYLALYDGQGVPQILRLHSSACHRGHSIRSCPLSSQHGFPGRRLSDELRHGHRPAEGRLVRRCPGISQMGAQATVVFPGPVDIPRRYAEMV